MPQPNQNRLNWVANSTAPMFASDAIAGDRTKAYHGLSYKVTSTSSRLGTKLKQTPQIWERFKKLEPGAPLKTVKPKWKPKDGNLTTFIYAGESRYIGGKCVRSRPSVDGEFATNFTKFTPSKAIRLSYWVKLKDFHGPSDTGVLKLTRVTATNSSGGGWKLAAWTISTVADSTVYSITFNSVAYSITSTVGATAQSIALQLSAKLQTDLPGWLCYVDTGNRVIVDIPLVAWNAAQSLTCSANMSPYSLSAPGNGGYYNGWGSTSMGGAGVINVGFTSMLNSYVLNITGGSGTSYTYAVTDGFTPANSAMQYKDVYVIAGTGVGQKLSVNSNTGSAIVFSTTPLITLDNTSVILVANDDIKYMSSGLQADVWQQIIQEMYIDTACTRLGFSHTWIDGTNVASMTNLRNCLTNRPYLFNNILLGTMLANTRIFYKPTTLTASTLYSIIVNSTTYSWTSTATSPTVQDVVSGLWADYYSKNTALVNGGNTTLLVDKNNLGLGIHFNASVTWSIGDWIRADRVPAICITDVHVDVGVGEDKYVRGFFVGNASTWNASTIREPQPYTKWQADETLFTIFAPTITGTMYLYYKDENGNVEALGEVNTNGLTIIS